MRKLMFAALALALLVMAPATASAEEDVRSLIGRTAYTLTNLHPDEGRARLYSANYLQSGLIPVCSKVVIEDMTHKKMRFTVIKTGRSYTFYDHKSNLGPFHVLLGRYFGSTCDPDAVKKLSEIDRKGILHGRAYPGMTRQGVIYAIGYPPEHETATLEMPRWKYWISRYNTLVLYFGEDGKVSSIQN